MEEGWSGIRYANPRRGLPHTEAKLRAREPVTVAFLGGSITEGYGATDPDEGSWRSLTEAYLEEKFPLTAFTFVNAGVGGTNSVLGAHRLQEHVFSGGAVDLLFVEFCVNDSEGRGRSEEDRIASIRGMEGIVRQCRRISPDTDIVFLYAADDKNRNERLPFYAAVHEEVAARYGIPSVNFVAGVFETVASGAKRWEQLAPDGVHPSDEGYALYAGWLQDFLDRYLKPAAGAAADSGTEPLLPEPLVRDNFEFARTLGIREAASVDRMDWSGEAPIPLINWRYGPEHLYTEQAGAGISFEAEGRGAGLLLLCGPDTGIFEYSVDDGPFVPYNPFDAWCLGVYRPVLALFPFREERSVMRVTVRNADGKDERSIGNGLRILRLLAR